MSDYPWVIMRKQKQKEKETRKRRSWLSNLRVTTNQQEATGCCNTKTRQNVLQLGQKGRRLISTSLIKPLDSYRSEAIIARRIRISLTRIHAIGKSIRDYLHGIRSAYTFNVSDSKRDSDLKKDDELVKSIEEATKEATGVKKVAVSDLNFNEICELFRLEQGTRPVFQVANEDLLQVPAGLSMCRDRFFCFMSAEII